MVQTRGPVGPGLMSPAFDRALASWLRARVVEEAKIATFEPQTISSILGASDRWSIIPAKYMLVEVECNVVVIGAYPLCVLRVHASEGQLVFFADGCAFGSGAGIVLDTGMDGKVGVGAGAVGFTEKGRGTCGRGLTRTKVVNIRQASKLQR